MKPDYIVVKDPDNKQLSWIEFVKKCKQERNLTQKEAMIVCKEPYKFYKSQYKKSELSKRPLPQIPYEETTLSQKPFTRPSKKRIDKYKKSELSKRPLPQIPYEETTAEEFETSLSDPEPVIELTEEEIYDKSQQRIYVPPSFKKYPLQAIPDKYRETERLRRMEYEEEIYRQNPDLQFAQRITGGIISSDIRKLYPDVQNVNYLSKQPHVNYYKPLKLENPYKGNGIASSAIIFEGLEKSGIFEGSKSVINTLTKKFDQFLDNPSAVRERQIITRIIPDLTYRYDVLQNNLDVYGKVWLPFRVRNHKLEQANIKSKIKSLITEITGIRSFK